MEKTNISKGLFGLDKKQVEQYILDLEADYRNIIDLKDKQISELQFEISELNKNMEKYIKIEKDLKYEKEAIGSVLLKAQEQANKLVEQTKSEFEKEKQTLEKVVENEREKLIEIKKDVGKIKLSLIDVLQKYKSELEKIEDNNI